MEETINWFVDSANITVLTHVQHIIFSVHPFALKFDVTVLVNLRRKSQFFLGKYCLKSCGLRAKDRDWESDTCRGWHFPYDPYKKILGNMMVHLTKPLKIILKFSSHHLRSPRDLSTKNSRRKQNPINGKGSRAGKIEHC